jgi:acetaldehyde dehydrogenase
VETGARLTAAIVGSGNIGTDLMVKLLRSDHLSLRYVVGVDPASEGLRRARELGVEASHEGVDWLLSRTELPDIVFEATSAAVHAANASRYADAGVKAVDLTPASLGTRVVPVVNMPQNMDAPNVNLVTCGGQATVPIVAAVSSVTTVHYAEIIASIASRSAGPGTRANIDEFTEATASALCSIGGSKAGKAIIILNPADPPMIMRNTIYCAIDESSDADAIERSLDEMIARVAAYVPGYRLRAPIQFDSARADWDGHARVAVLLEVEGRGDTLPAYAGNLDIMTSAAARVGELLAGAGEVALTP